MSKLVLAVSMYVGASTCYQKHLHDTFINRKEDEMMVPKLKQAGSEQQRRSTPITYKYVPVIKRGLLRTETAVQ